MISPVTFQGGKHRLAPVIASCILERNPDVFWEGYCGGGSVTLQLIARGFDPRRVIMIDNGPWGVVWRLLGDGTFDLARLKTLIADIPQDCSLVSSWLTQQAASPVVAHDAPYKFLILQAGSFGGKAIGLEGNQWRHAGFRSAWLPTATSKRRTKVNPMMPMPGTILSRIETLIPRVRGVTVLQADVSDVQPDDDAVCYLDPPYVGTTGYPGGETCPVQSVVESWLERARCVAVSEARPLNDGALRLESSKKGGISGQRSRAAEEWLTWFDRIS